MGGHGHTVTVRPDANNSRADANPTAAQIGRHNAVTTFHYAHGANKRPEVRIDVYGSQ